MFRIKICGLTNVADALAAVAAGADAIGVNFHPGSPRYVSPPIAAGICQAVAGRVVRVGVFVNSLPAEIRRIAGECPLDAVQLHGDEPPAVLAALAGLPVVRALRIDKDLAAAERYVHACTALKTLPRMLLADAAVPGQYGGSGKTLPWELLAIGRGQLGGLPLILAGGLHAGNVATAIVAVRPHGVDVASGVEQSPGKKSSDRMRAFVAVARQALAELGRPA